MIRFGLLAVPGVGILLALLPALLWAQIWLEELPTNEWSKLTSTSSTYPYLMSEMIWAPSRRQILHWGATKRWTGGGGATGGKPQHNDVVAFDVETGGWVSDYPSDDPAPVAFSISRNAKMLPSGNPAPGNVVGGVAWDSTRQRLVYAMPGLTAAYDPSSRSWEVLKASSRVPAHEGSEAPKVYGTGMAYDPINDELLMFPHWPLTDEHMIPVTGEVSAHAGTLAYRFSDGTWRSLRSELGTDEQHRQRQAVEKILSRVSEGLDLAHAARAGGAVSNAGINCSLATAADAAMALADAHSDLARALEDAADNLSAASEGAVSGDYAKVLRRGRNALWTLGTVLDDVLRIEPPPRAAADMEWHPKHEVIVMYGGISGLVRTDLPDNRQWTPGTLSDTWLYDPRTRSWREIASDHQPPPQARSHLAYDPESGLMLLVTRSRSPGTVTLWGLDLETESWSRLQQMKWPFEWDDELRYVTGHTPFELAFDPDHRLLVMTQKQNTFVMKLDLAALTPSLPDAPVPRPPIEPLEVPDDDPAWVTSLSELPANTWRDAHPKGGEPHLREWGNLAYDRVRGWVYYFGGGHASYQINNVSIYSVGANRWVTGVGEHNDRIPPVAWGGNSMSFRGGAPAAHQRNNYTAVDGRMYVWNGGTSFYSDKQHNQSALEDKPRYSWFYDVDRGGIWRRQRVTVQLGERVKGAYGNAQLSDPRGRVLGFQTNRGQYYGKQARQMWLGIHDIYADSLKVREIPAPYPPLPPESVPFSYMPDRDQIFYYGHPPAEGAPHTWAYDLDENRFIDLEPSGSPTEQPAVVVYLEGQNAIFAANEKPKEQWLYSLQHHEWKQLPPAGNTIKIQEPYGQVVYAPRYGVLVNVGKRTSVMRVDASELWPDLQTTRPAESYAPLSAPVVAEEVCAAIQLPVAQ